MAQGHWRTRGAGAATGAIVMVGAGAAALPEYIDDPRVGIMVGAAGGLVGFSIGLWWDRRAARIEAEAGLQARWDTVLLEAPEIDESVSRERGSLLALLEPWAQVVPFERGHLRHVTSIRRWCTERQPGRVWLVEGGPGSGKTRLALRVAESLRKHQQDPWDCGWLALGRRLGTSAVELAGAWRRPVLIIVDDADQRDDIGELLTALHQLGPSRQQVRLLLLAREFRGWWMHAQQHLTFPVDRAEMQTSLGPLGRNEAEQRAAARRAAASFAKELKATLVVRDVSLSNIRAETPVILLHATALEAVAQAMEGREARADVADALGRLLQRERERWWREAVNQNLTAYPEVTESTLRNVLAIAMLVGARDEASGDSLLRSVPGLAEASPELMTRLTIWLHLYGVTAGYYIRPHLTPALAEHLVADAMAGNTALATAIAAGAATREEARYVLKVLAHATAHTPTAPAAARTLIEADPRRLLPVATTLALDGVGGLDVPIAEAMSAMKLDWKLADQLLRQIGNNEESVLPLAGLALAQLSLPLATSQANRASVLMTYASFLQRAGDVEGAAIRADEGIKLWDALAAEDPEEYSFHRAKALVAYSSVHGHAGHRDRSAEAAREAVSLWRRLSEVGPADYESCLVEALYTLCGAERLAGRLPEALVAGAEAVDRARKLSGHDPRYRRDLATALLSHSVGLQIGNRTEEAVAAIQEAVQTRRELADRHPVFLESYAEALAILSETLRHLRRHDSAVNAARLSVEHYERLTAQNPLYFRPFAARATLGLAFALHDARRTTVAAATAERAVELWRALADESAVHEPYLGRALTLLALVFRDSGENLRAADTAEEASNLYRRLSSTNPAASALDFAQALTIHAVSANLVGRRRFAAKSADEAIRIYQELESKNGTALANLSPLRRIVADRDFP
jgi:hypothetical protein